MSRRTSSGFARKHVLGGAKRKESAPCHSVAVERSGRRVEFLRELALRLMPFQPRWKRVNGARVEEYLEDPALRSLGERAGRRMEG